MKKFKYYIRYPAPEWGAFYVRREGNRNLAAFKMVPKRAEASEFTFDEADEYFAHVLANPDEYQLVLIDRE